MTTGYSGTKNTPPHLHNKLDPPRDIEAIAERPWAQDPDLAAFNPAAMHLRLLGTENPSRAPRCSTRSRPAPEQSASSPTWR
ncbi:hypothetical protein ACFVH6_37455 [Spirillospora sp. NPDC127200]